MSKGHSAVDSEAVGTCGSRGGDASVGRGWDHVAMGWCLVATGWDHVAMGRVLEAFILDRVTMEWQLAATGWALLAMVWDQLMCDL